MLAKIATIFYDDEREMFGIQYVGRVTEQGGTRIGMDSAYCSGLETLLIYARGVLTGEYAGDALYVQLTKEKREEYEKEAAHQKERLAKEREEFYKERAAGRGQLPRPFEGEEPGET